MAKWKKIKSYKNGGEWKPDSSARVDSNIPVGLSTSAIPSALLTDNQKRQSAIKTKSTLDKVKKATALGSLIPHPYIQYPSIAINSAIGAYDVYNDINQGDYRQAVIDGVTSIPVPYVNPAMSPVAIPLKQLDKIKRFNTATSSMNVIGALDDWDLLKKDNQQYKNGGAVQGQWDLPSDPITPGYQDYGTMYTVPQWPGLLPKKPGTDNSWDGYGNTNNLIQQPNWNRIPVSGTSRQQPSQQLAMNPSDYSIDSVRSQYMQKGGKIKQNPPIYVDNINDPRYRAYQDSLGLYNRGVEDNKFFREHSGNIPIRKFPFSKVTSYSVNANEIGKIKPISAYTWDNISSDHPDYYRAHWFGYKKPEQQVILGQQINKLPINKSQPYQPQQVQVPPYTPVDRTQEWYSNNRNIPIDAKDVSPLYNEDGTRKYKEGGTIENSNKMSEQRKGYYWNGTSWKKSVGTGTYSNGVYFKTGGLYKVGGTPCYECGGTYKDGGIHIKPENKGKFSQWASAHGMGVQEAASHVMANKEDYSPTIVKRANFAKNFGGKKQYGGYQYAAGGVIDPEGGLSLPSANNAWGSSAANTQQQMQDVYSPVQQTNAAAPQMDPNSYANRPMVTQQRVNMNEQPVDASGFNNPYQSAPEQEQDSPLPPQQPRQPLGTNYRNLLGAGMIFGNWAANMRQNKNLQAFGVKQGMTSIDNPVAGNRGQYNQQGQLMQQFQPPARMGMYGGKMPQYKMGGTYSVSNAELSRLRKLGYEIEEL